MFKRKVYDYLKAWKEESDGRSAVMIEGARRVGKSTVVEEFARKEYDDYILIDFSTAEQAIKDNFDNISNMDTFFRNFFVLTGKTLKKRRGVIIFDEVRLYRDRIVDFHSKERKGHPYSFGRREYKDVSDGL